MLRREMSDAVFDAVVRQIGREHWFRRSAARDLRLKGIIPTFDKSMMRIELKKPLLAVIVFLYAGTGPACATAFARFAMIEDEPYAVRECRPGERLVLLVEDCDR